MNLVRSAGSRGRPWDIGDGADARRRRWSPGPAIGRAAAFLLLLGGFTSSAPLAAASPTNMTDTTSLLLVVGAPGEPDYAAEFARTARRWESAARPAGAKVTTLGLSDPGDPQDLDRLRQALEAEPREGTGPLWLVLIGHGTFDGREAKFNLRGPDLTATNLAGWLGPFRRPLAVVNTASASAPFINALSAPGRVIVTATRSGSEQNLARFGGYLAETIADPEADLDQDSQVSLLEAFLTASHRVAEFYRSEGRLATEHALLDDNGDRLGTPADWFRGLRAVKKAPDGTAHDGLRAHQFHLVPSPEELQLPPDARARRDALELAIARLREAKAALPEDDYYRQLESLLLDLARLYQRKPLKE